MTNNKEYLFKELSYKVIGACFRVHSALGCALPEHCYQRALVHEFELLGIPCSSEEHFPVYYKELGVGLFYSDLIIDNKIILELKSSDKLIANHFAQLLTYLRVTKLKVGYLVSRVAKRNRTSRLSQNRT
jgi:GxxExxY protein